MKTFTETFLLVRNTELEQNAVTFIKGLLLAPYTKPVNEIMADVLLCIANAHHLETEILFGEFSDDLLNESSHLSHFAHTLMTHALSYKNMNDSECEALSVHMVVGVLDKLRGEFNLDDQFCQARLKMFIDMLGAERPKFYMPPEN